MKKYRFRNWLRKVLIHFDSDAEEKFGIRSRNQVLRSESDSSLEADPIRLNIYMANGGVVVETKVYDRQRDRNNTQLYIVNGNEDLGDQLSKIVTMVSLGR